MTERFTRQEIIDAYQRTGSVWRAAKELGCCGQSVHERLVTMGYPMPNRRWTKDELDELRALVQQVPLGEVARRLGRPYAGVAIKVSRLGLHQRRAQQGTLVKLPRGAGFDKASVSRYRRDIDTSGTSVKRYARQQGIGMEQLCQALERHFPEWWAEYRRSRSDLPERSCAYCELPFIPSTARQTYCSRKCGSDSRADRSYFGGQRRNAVGMAERQCQLCERTGIKGLSAHHMIGKENDPNDESLIALCQGCHQLVSHLGGRKFTDDRERWEQLIALVWLRRHGAERGGVEVTVMLETLTEEDLLGEELA